jgi:hypothetical protein
MAIVRVAQHGLPKKKGALTYALNQALVCLARNAFGTPRLGRASNAVPAMKLPVSIQTAAEATQIGFVVFWSFF